MWKKGSIQKRSRKRAIDHHRKLVAIFLGNLQVEKKWKNVGPIFDLDLKCSSSIFLLINICIDQRRRRKCGII